MIVDFTINNKTIGDFSIIDDEPITGIGWDELNNTKD